MDAFNSPAIRALGFLAFLTLADSTASSSVPAILGSTTPLEPGYWNLGAAAIVISTITELISQLVLGVLADKKGTSYAIFLNTSSIFISSTSILLSLTFRGTKTFLPFVIPSSLKIIGGGSHATVFLTLVLLRDRASGSSRTAIIFISGAVMALFQAAGLALTPQLLKCGETLPCVLSIVCCVLAYVLLVLDIRLDTSAPSPDLSIQPSTQPLLNEPQVSQEAQADGFLVRASKFLALDSVLGSRNLALSAAIFFTAGISKATRPLFTTYIQRRYGFSPDQASQLWLMRTIIAVALFAALLPLAVYIQSRRAGSCLSKTTLLASRISISLMGIGALTIGLARTRPVLITALVVNSLGIVNDLSLLAFVAEIILEKTAGRIFMLLASLEYLGTLLGVGILYPVYQWSMRKESWTAGSTYYICAALYASVAGFIWYLRQARITI